MIEYVKIWGYITLFVDLVTLILAAYSLYHNFNELKPNKNDTPYRALLLVMSFAYSIANYNAISRHIDVFIIKATLNLSASDAESLIYDRGFMMFTAFILFCLTRKWTPSWFIR